MHDFRTDYDIEAGDQLDVTIRLTATGEEQTGTWTATTGQSGEPAGRFGVKNKHGDKLSVNLYYMRFQLDNDDAIAGVAPAGAQDNKVAEVIEMEVN